MRSPLRLAVVFSSASISPLKASHSLCSHNHVGSCLAAKNILSESAMEKKHSQDKRDQIREAHYKESCENSERKHISDDIIPHILHLYGSCATPRDFEIYAPDASFEDPLMCANGVKQIKSAFYSLSKIFSESRIVEYTVEENLISPGKQESCINVALNFVLPENVGECICLTEEFRILPQNHRAKEDKLEVKKMIVYAMSHVVKRLEQKTKLTAVSASEH